MTDRELAERLWEINAAMAIRCKCGECANGFLLIDKACEEQGIVKRPFRFVETEQRSNK